jgi:hypothetical protein
LLYREAKTGKRLMSGVQAAGVIGGALIRF